LSQLHSITEYGQIHLDVKQKTKEPDTDIAAAGASEVGVLMFCYKVEFFY
jgi:hypothetical protein